MDSILPYIYEYSDIDIYHNVQLRPFTESGHWRIIKPIVDFFKNGRNLWLFDSLRLGFIND